MRATTIGCIRREAVHLMDAVAGAAVEGRRWFTALLSLGVVTALAAALLQLVASGASRWSFAALSTIPHALAGASVVLLAALNRPTVGARHRGRGGRRRARCGGPATGAA
ncbi:MAG: hypothetical protein M3R63_15265 [Actinomycetota bacterium]|nr:hypothetical protein [Actinomycetota bacterium]